MIGVFCIRVILKIEDVDRVEILGDIEDSVRTRGFQFKFAKKMEHGIMVPKEFIKILK